MRDVRNSSGGNVRRAEVHQSQLLPAFDRAIASAEMHARQCPEDKHQVWALKKGKKAVLESLKNGHDIGISVLHTLTGVGHWVVQQVKEHLDPSSGVSTLPSAKRPRASAPPATPQSFTWWYIDKRGKYVVERQRAEFQGPPGRGQYRVLITHGSGRVEKAWLPFDKAPPESKGIPPGEDVMVSKGRDMRASQQAFPADSVSSASLPVNDLTPRPVVSQVNRSSTGKSDVPSIAAFRPLRTASQEIDLDPDSGDDPVLPLA